MHTDKNVYPPNVSCYNWDLTVQSMAESLFLLLLTKIKLNTWYIFLFTKKKSMWLRIPDRASQNSVSILHCIQQCFLDKLRYFLKYAKGEKDDW